MKKYLILIFALAISLVTLAQEPRVDTVAVMILDRMSDVIGDLNSCRFTLNRSFDIQDPDLGTVTHSGTDEVYMKGPDKMLVHSAGEKGHIGFYYSSDLFTIYSFDENNYATIEAPSTILATIDSVHKAYGIEFPAADFFYPTFTDDILERFGTIAYLGRKVVNNKECFHLLASNKELIVQFWISNDAYNLPEKFIIIYKSKENIRYEASFCNWELNPDIPDAVFNFLPPPMAARISILAR
jgi:hypothetical protein